jgi:hypothetical protein
MPRIFLALPSAAMIGACQFVKLLAFGAQLLHFCHLLVVQLAFGSGASIAFHSFGQLLARASEDASARAANTAVCFMFPPWLTIKHVRPRGYSGFTAHAA